jgi:cell division protein FtsB
MGLFISALRRGLILIAIWALASVQLYRATACTLEHRRLTSEIETMQRDYDEQLEDYSRILAEAEALRSDDRTKIDYLKKEYGYTEPDETPIIITRSAQ